MMLFGRVLRSLVLALTALVFLQGCSPQAAPDTVLMHKEDLLGSLEIGKLADLVVLDQDYMTIPVQEIPKLRSVLTMVDGRIVYADL
jgi:cytosine/adenosine deaminase-related metal-dependent hydrolase